MPAVVDRPSLAQAITRLSRNRTVQHLLFWVLSFYILLRFFAYDKQLTPTDWIYTFLFHLSLVMAVYVNHSVLIPRLLSQAQYFAYLLAVAVLLFASAYVNRFTFTYLADWLFPGYYFISYYGLRDILQFMGVYVVATTLLKLSKGWFILQDREKKIARLEREKLQVELRALKSQLDPHFLFNNLNNLYSLALEQDERAPEVILELSENLRYMLYECGAERTPLHRELDFIRRYVGLERLRAGAQPTIHLQIEGEAGEQEIAPLLLLPFIENACKYGLKGKATQPFVEFKIAIQDGVLHFSAVNTRGRASETGPEVSGGIGLDNARRRLELLYPGKHDLQVVDQNGLFAVTLKLDMT